MAQWRKKRSGTAVAKVQGAKPLVLAALGLGATLGAMPPQAQARVDHFRPAQAADNGFGPTAGGVSSILIDAGNGQVLAATQADMPRYPASLTKLMTLDLAFEALRDGRMQLDTPIVISEHAAAVEPVKLGFAAGRSITAQQAILAMTTMSANDAATALGEYLGGGSEAHCADLMNARARQLGMVHTHFDNASGLPDPAQVTTARDLAILARDIVVNFPQDQPFFEVQKFNLQGHTIYSNNQMLKFYPGATGMKTGYTILARHNLVTSASRDGHVLIGVELHEPSWGATYQNMTAMLDSGFNRPLGGTTVALNNAPALPGNNNDGGVAVPVPASPHPVGAVAVTHGQGPSFISSARAETIRPPARTVANRSAVHAKPIELAGNQNAAKGINGGWVVDLGSYKLQNSARAAALAAQHKRGQGVARIIRLDSHGKILWRAQLVGLSREGAHATCSLMGAQRHWCSVIAPESDHLASRSLSEG